LHAFLNLEFITRGEKENARFIFIISVSSQNKSCKAEFPRTRACVWGPNFLK